jgi:hypothetical protein
MKLMLCAGSGEGSDHLGSLYATFPCNFARGYFHDLNPDLLVTSAYSHRESNQTTIYNEGEHTCH